MAHEKSTSLLSLAPQFGGLAVVLAIAAAFLPIGSNAPHAPTPPAAEATPVSDPSEQAFAAFLREAGLVKKDHPTRLKVSSGQVLIATLPNPIETDFGFWFDQCIESISRAMADADGYGLERYWYPWLATKKVKPAAESGVKLVDLGWL